MEKTKSKSSIIKLLFSILIILTLMIIKSSNVQADIADASSLGANDFPDSFNMGVMDFYGGSGMPFGPEPYYFGDFFCSNHHTQLTRRVNGSTVVYVHRTNKGYWNESITYDKFDTRELEQSIAAGYYMYKAGAGSNVELQNVVWASGQWASKKGYVQNLVQYKGDTANGSASSKLISRAEDWANFYYNLIVPSGNNKINIEVKPDTPDSLRVMVNQPDRTFIQGPYKIDIINSSGASMSGTATQHIQSPNIGTLVYNEIMGNNVGQDVLRFCEVGKAVATIKYTDGSTSTQIVNTPTTQGTVKLLDEAGNEILFPQFGQQFFIKVAVSPAESAGRTVETVEMDFDLDFTTKFKGTTHMYKAGEVRYELNNEILKVWTDFGLKYDLGNQTGWFLKKTIDELIAEAGTICKPSQLLTYIEKQIRERAIAAGVDHVGFMVGQEQKFEAYVYAIRPNETRTYYGLRGIN